MAPISCASKYLTNLLNIYQPNELMSRAPVVNSSVQKGFLLLVVSIVITLVISASSLHFYVQSDDNSSGECKSCDKFDIDPPTYSGDDRSYVALCLSVKGKHHRQ